MKDYIITVNKMYFAPLEPEPERILIEDIAHSLSLMTRANGHFPQFYSVGQHCIHCYEEALARGYNTRLVKACLLHDASEAYLADITRPVKKNLPQYLTIEKKLQNTIYERFLGSSLTDEESRQVSIVDDALLFYEFKHFMNIELQCEAPEILTNPDFSFVSFEEVEKKYILFSQS